MNNLKSILKNLADSKTCAVSLDDSAYISKGVIPTGSIGLNYALSVGGYPRGRIIEVYGENSCGKSLMAFMAIKEIQKSGGIAGYVDAEYTLDRTFLTNLGVDTTQLLVAQNADNSLMSGEQCLQHAINLVKAGVDLVVVDSVAALVPQAQLDGQIGEDKTRGVHAKMMSEGLRRLTAEVGVSNAVVVLINQTRSNAGALYTSPEVTTGGKALPFYASVRLRVTKLTGKDNVYYAANGDVIGHRARVKVVKNKVGIPLRECEFDVYYKSGIDTISELLDAAIINEIILRPNNITYTYKDQSFKGRAAVNDAIKKSVEFQNELKEALNALS